MKRLLFLLLLLVSGRTIAQIPETWLSFEKNNATIRYPDSLWLNETGHLGAEFLLLWPTTNGTFRANINLLVQDLSGFPSLKNQQDYVDFSLDQIHSMPQRAQMISQQALVLNDRLFHELIYTLTQQQYTLICHQYCHVHHQKAYLITFTCLQNEYDLSVPLAKQVMSSLHLHL